MLPKKIKKRDGTVANFDSDKIGNAISAAFAATYKGKDDEESNEFCSKSVHKEVLESIFSQCENEVITVEEVQDIVEDVLMCSGVTDVAKNYIIYRYQHAEDRETMKKLQFIDDYSNAKNAASGSKFDANANVENKNLATLIGELPKGDFIRLNRRMLTDTMTKMYGKQYADMYIKLLKSHLIYKNDETSMANYCASITMYPWLLDGTKAIGGNSTAPTNLKSFAGGFINMVFIVSSMLSGACATPEFLMYLDYFIRLEYGDDYYTFADTFLADNSKKKRTLKKVIQDIFEQVVYSINQPTGARNFQSVFWNISYYDRYYFESLFENFFFPDGSRPQWESLSWLQKCFMKWFNNERTKTVLTFPVETMAMLVDNETQMPKDEEWCDFACEMYAEGHSFFTYLSDSADSLSSCCRLRNEIKDNEFSYTLGAGGISTGSKSVLTINMNRLVQTAANMQPSADWKTLLEDVVDLCHKTQMAYDKNLRRFKAAGLLPLFDAGYIDLGRQYLTIGINGIVEAAEFFGIEISDNAEYQNFVETTLSTIERFNKKYTDRDNGIMFNCEMIPAENVGVKHAKWDKEDGLKVNRDCYNSYFYIVEDTNCDPLQKFRLHGRKYIQHLTGGSALHMNLEEHLSKAQYKQLMHVASKEGCNYFTFNIPNTLCNSCGHISKHNLKKCPKCGSEDLDYLTRIIGYLKRVSNFSAPRQVEAKKRYYANAFAECN